MAKKQKTNNNKKQQRGITLIALVITIIVLLILAGVSITMLTGDNSILQKSTEAKGNTERKSVIESAQIEIVGQQTENKSDKIEKNQLQSILSKYFQNVPDMSEMSKEEILSKKLSTLPKYGTYTIEVSEIFNGTFKEIKKIRTALDLREGEIVRYNSSAGNIDCIVLYDSTEEDFENLGVQIISLDMVGDDIEIGNGTRSDNYTNDATLFNTASESYNSAVTTLNNKAKTYLKNSTNDIASDARCVGSNPISKNSVSETRTVGEFTYHYPDSNYEKDFTQIQKEEISVYSTTKEFWLASYSYNTAGQGSLGYGSIRIVSGSSLNYKSPVYYDYNYRLKYSKSCTCSLRPVFIIKSESKIQSGSGTTENPYILEL